MIIILQKISACIDGGSEALLFDFGAFMPNTPEQFTFRHSCSLLDFSNSPQYPLSLAGCEIDPVCTLTMYGNVLKPFFYAVYLT